MAADAVLSVEVRAKLDNLSANLKKGEVSIDDFVHKGNTSLATIEQKFSSLGKTAKEIADNLNKSFRNLSFGKMATDVDQAKLALFSSKVQVQAYKEELEKVRLEHQKLKNELHANNKAIADAKLAFEQGKVTQGSYRTEVERLKLELQKLRLQQVQNRQQTQAAAGSYREAQQRLTALGKSIREAEGSFNSSNKHIQNQIIEYRKLNDKLTEFDRRMGNNYRNVGNYQSAFKGLQTSLMRLASVYTLINSLNNVFVRNIDISDNLADVQRTSQLTKQELYELTDAIKNLPTRTSLKELLDITVIGGQLGIAKEELVGFTHALDFLGVALAKEIPGGASQIAESLGKINGVFQVAQKEGTSAGDAMQKTGSAILALGQAGLATGKFLVDFTQRVGGASVVAGIALPTMLAYGATLEESGISAEVAGTAISKLIGQLAGRRDEFYTVAKIADASLTIEQFTNTINTDANKALNQFFEGLKQGGKDLTSFYDILNAAGIRSERYRSAILAISNNQSRMNELLDIGTQAYEDGSLAAEQYAIRNLNLSGVIQQLTQNFKNAFINPKFSQSVADMIATLLNLTDKSTILARKLEDVTTLFSEQHAQITKLIAEYQLLSTQTFKTAGESQRLKEVINELGRLIPGAVTEWDRYGNAILISTDKIYQLSDAHRQLIKDMNISFVKRANKEYDELTRRATNYIKLLAVSSTGKPTGFLGAFVSHDDFLKGLDRNKEKLAKTNEQRLTLLTEMKNRQAELNQEQLDFLSSFENNSPLRKIDDLAQSQAKLSTEIIKNKNYWDEQVKSLKEARDALAENEIGTQKWIELSKSLTAAQQKVSIYANIDMSKSMTTHANQAAKEARDLAREQERLNKLLIVSYRSAHEVQLQGVTKILEAVRIKYADWKLQAQGNADVIAQLEVNKAIETQSILHKLFLKTLQEREQKELQLANKIKLLKINALNEAIKIELDFTRRFDETTAQRSIRELNKEFTTRQQELVDNLKSQSAIGVDSQILGAFHQRNALQEEYFQRIEQIRQAENAMRLEMVDGRNIFNTSLEKSGILLEDLNRKYQAGALTLNEYRKISDYLLSQQELLGTLKNSYDQLTTGIGDAFSNMLIGAESFSDGMQKVVQGMVSNIISQLARLAAIKILSALFTGGTSLFLPGFNRGGYTGPGHTNDVAGIVHKREYVVNAEATRKHRPLLENLNAGVLPSEQFMHARMQQPSSFSPSIQQHSFKPKLDLNISVSGAIRNNIIRLGNKKAERVDRKLGRMV